MVSLKTLLQNSLLVAVLLELFLGGNGYLLEIGGFRIRVLLTSLCYLWVGVSLLSKPTQRFSIFEWLLLFTFGLVTAVGVLAGIANGNNFSFMATELRGLLYVPMLMFFSLAVTSANTVERIAKMIVICGVLQAVLFLSVIVSMHTHIVGYFEVYSFLRRSDEFIFRHNPNDIVYWGFLYKGAFHLGVAFVFAYFMPIRLRLLTIAVLLLAIMFTETRGFWVAIVVTLLVGLLLRRKYALLAVFLSTLLLACALFLAGPISTPSAREATDAVRLADIVWIASRIDLPQLFYGNGMGAVIRERSRIENIYLELFYKQGMIGLLPWLGILVMSTLTCLSIRGRLSYLAIPFYLSIVYTYVVSVFNNFLTGSTGMCIVLLGIVALKVLRKSEVSCAEVPRYHV